MERFIYVFKGFYAPLLTILLVMSGSSAKGQVTSAHPELDSLEVSLLTCQPHDQIYSLYGHTAIRVRFGNTGEDIAVNFGVFDFDSDNFVLRFVFGLTDYRMGIQPFRAFLNEYAYYGSGVYQQRLSLTHSEKMAFLAALREQSRPENVVYRYNYYYNNCTTKARDLLLSAVDGEVRYDETSLQSGERSFRDLIHLHNEDHRWARFGNDMLLGMKSDFNTSHSERQFLPQVLANDFDSAYVVMPDNSQHHLVDTAYWVLLPGAHYASSGGMPLSPTAMAAIVFCVIMAYCLSVVLIRKRNLPWVDYIISIPYGVCGLVLTAMIFSQHPTVSLNLQILTFNPLWLVLLCPAVRVRYRWQVVVTFLALFFLCNIVQSYAEGMNIMALSLLLLALTNLYLQRKQTKGKAR